MKRTLGFLTLATLILLPLAKGAPSITENGDGTTTYFDDFSQRSGPTDYGTLDEGCCGVQGVLGQYRQVAGSGFSSFVDTTSQHLVAQFPGSGALAWGTGYCGTDGLANCQGQAGAASPESIWEPCVAGGTPNLAVSFTLKILSDATMDGSGFGVGLNSAGPGGTVDQIGVLGSYILADDEWSIAAYAAIGVSSSGGNGIRAVAGQSVGITISGINCGTGQGFVGIDNVGSSLDVPVGSWSDPTDLAGFLAYGSGNNDGGSFAIDNVTVTAPTPAATGTDEDRFCPDVGIPNSPSLEGAYGWNYAEDVTFDSDGQATVSLDDSYQFNGGGSDAAYAAKGWTSKTYLSTHFTIEALSDGTGAIFRPTYSFIDHTPYVVGSLGDESFTTSAKGNGETTGIFASSVWPEFQELNDDWRIAWRRVVAGTQVEVGASFRGLNPNDANSFEVIIRTNTPQPWIALKLSTGETLLNNTLSEIGMSIAQGTAVRSMWFVAESDAIEVDTFVNNNDASWSSTCIFFYAGTPGVLGPAGEIPFSETPEGNVTEPETGAGGILLGGTGVLPDGWTVTAFNGFLGIVLMAALTGGLYFALGKSPIAAMIGAALGFLMAFFFGLFALWIIVVVLIVAIAIIFLKIKNVATTGG